MSNKIADCGLCGKTITYTKMNRHLKKCNTSLLGIGWNQVLKPKYSQALGITYSYKEKK